MKYQSFEEIPLWQEIRQFVSKNYKITEFGSYLVASHKK